MGGAYYFFFQEPNMYILINDNQYILNLTSNASRLEGQKLYIEQENTIFVPNLPSKFRVFMNNKEIAQNIPVNFTLKNLASGNYINIRLRNTDTGEDFFTDISTLPNAYRGIFTTSLSPESGFYYFTLRNTIYKMNTVGDIIYFNKRPNPVLDFQPHEFNGKMYYSFLGSYDTEIFEPEPGYERNSMYVQILDEHYQDYHYIKGLIPTEKAGVNSILAINGFIMLGENHYMLFGTTKKQVTNIPDHLPHDKEKGAQVAATIIQEIKDGKLIFEWDSTDYPELYEIGYEYNDFTNKKYPTAVYTFLNNIVIDPKDDNLYLSFRVADAVVKIDRKKGTIISILGGKKDMFNIKPEQRFMSQHSLTLGSDGKLIIFNNGVANERRTESESNIMSFKLDDENKTIEKFEKFVFKKKYCFGMGDAREVKKNIFLVSWGKTVPPLSLFTEVDFNQDISIFEVQYNTRNYNYATFKFHK